MSGQLGALMGTGTRMMYRSNDAQGKPVAVTGTYIDPDNPWPGKGPRPLLAYVTLPYGMGEQCAPSRMFNQGIHASLDTGLDVMFAIEEGFIATLLARGFAPALLNKLSINSFLTVFVDGERSMAWVADWFNGVPMTPNCGEI